MYVYIGKKDCTYRVQYYPSFQASTRGGGLFPQDKGGSSVVHCNYNYMVTMFQADCKCTRSCVFVHLVTWETFEKNFWCPGGAHFCQRASFHTSLCPWHSRPEFLSFPLRSDSPLGYTESHSYSAQHSVWQNHWYHMQQRHFTQMWLLHGEGFEEPEAAVQDGAALVPASVDEPQTGTFLSTALGAPISSS